MGVVEDEHKYGVVMQVIWRDFWEIGKLPLSRLPKSGKPRRVVQQRHSYCKNADQS